MGLTCFTEWVVVQFTFRIYCATDSLGACLYSCLDSLPDTVVVEQKTLTKTDDNRILDNRNKFRAFPFGNFDIFFGVAALNRKTRDHPVHYKALTYSDTNLSWLRNGWPLLRMSRAAASSIKFI